MSTRTPAIGTVQTEPTGVITRTWPAGTHPQHLVRRQIYPNGKKRYDEWEPGKGPDGITRRVYSPDGRIEHQK